MTLLSERLSVVLLTHNRAQEVLHTLEKLLALPTPPRIIVIDNASSDDTAKRVDKQFPEAVLIVTERNIGAAARKLGVIQAQTEYVAFGDDDSWWAEGALEQAVQVLDANPRVAALSARILLGPEEEEDPVCQEMARSPFPSEGVPGPALLGLIACAAVFRREAYLAVGGYRQQFFVGGEEELVAMDLWSRGWSIVYAPRLHVHHWPSPVRDNPARQKTVIRNALWVAWLRLPASEALRRSWAIRSAAAHRKVLPAALAAALHELFWVAGQRKVAPDHVLSLYRRLHG